MLLNANNFRFFYSIVAGLYFALTFVSADVKVSTIQLELFLYHAAFFWITTYIAWEQAAKSFPYLYTLTDHTPESINKSKFAGFDLIVEHNEDEKQKALAELNSKKRTLGYILKSATLLIAFGWLKFVFFGLSASTGVINTSGAQLLLIFIFTTARFWGAHLLSLYLALFLYVLNFSGDSIFFYLLSFLFILCFFMLHIALTSWYWQKMSGVSFLSSVKNILKKLAIPYLLFVTCFILMDNLIPQKESFMDKLSKKLIQKFMHKTMSASSGLRPNLSQMSLPSPLTDHSAQKELEELHKKDELKLENMNHFLRQQQNIFQAEIDKLKEELSTISLDQNTDSKKISEYEKEIEMLEKDLTSSNKMEQKTSKLNEAQNTIAKEMMNNQQELSILKAMKDSPQFKKLEPNSPLQNDLYKMFQEEIAEINKKDFDYMLTKSLLELDINPTQIDLKQLEGENALIDLHEKSFQNFQKIEALAISENINVAKAKQQLADHFQYNEKLNQSVGNFLTQFENLDEAKLNQMIEQKKVETQNELARIKKAATSEEIKKISKDLKDKKLQEQMNAETSEFTSQFFKNQHITQDLKLQMERLRDKQEQLVKSQHELQALKNKNTLKAQDLATKLEEHKYLKANLAQVKAQLTQNQEKQLKQQILKQEYLANERAQTQQKFKLKENLYQNLNQNISKQDFPTTKDMIENILEKHQAGQLDLSQAEQEQLRSMQTSLQKPLKKKFKSNLSQDYAEYIKNLFLIIAGFIFIYLFSKFSRKKSYRTEPIINAEIANKIKLDFKKLPKRFKNFREEVLCHYRFFHNSMDEIFFATFPEEKAPPPLIIAEKIDQDEKLNRSAKIMAMFFNVAVYEDRTKFSIKQRNQFRESFKYFLRTFNI